MKDLDPFDSQKEPADDPQQEDYLVRVLNRKIGRIDNPGLEGIAYQRRNKCEAERL